MPLRRDQCWMALALRRRTEYSGREIIIERPDRRRRLSIQSNISLIWNTSGALLGAVNVFMDITDWEELKEEQHQLHMALAHLGRFSLAGVLSAGIAHELAQPLTAIVNYSEACLNLLRSGRGQSRGAHCRHHAGGGAGSARR